MIRKNIKISFVSEKLEKEFDKLRKGMDDEKKLFFLITRAFNDIEKDLNSCIKIQKPLWPKSYKQKYKINNLWKYDLPNGWRLIFSLKDDEIVVYAVILEWFSHKDYERRFKY
jgi:mRNA-degrading endonuclease RelE of RelBE toxin-antitoxin system